MSSLLEKLSFLTASPRGKHESLGMMTRMLVLLLAQYLLYYDLHWKYSARYGDHLLFQRLYENVQKELDSLAEKIIGYHGSDSINMSHLATLAGERLASWTGTPPERGLAAEKELQNTFHELYDLLKAKDLLPMGLDDFIMAVCNDHETHTYLLQQIREDRDTGKVAEVYERYKLAGVAAPANNEHEGIGGLVMNDEDLHSHERAAAKKVHVHALRALAAPKQAGFPLRMPKKPGAAQQARSRMKAKLGAARTVDAFAQALEKTAISATAVGGTMEAAREAAKKGVSTVVKSSGKSGKVKTPEQVKKQISRIKRLAESKRQTPTARRIQDVARVHSPGGGGLLARAKGLKGDWSPTTGVEHLRSVARPERKKPGLLSRLTGRKAGRFSGFQPSQITSRSGHALPRAQFPRV
jgi:DNA-binding ferritin-like protein